jgi:hypothetical protein
MEKYLSKNSLKRDLFPTLVFSAQDQERIMMKQKNKTRVEEQVEKLVKKKPMSKAKESHKMLQWMKMDSYKFKWARRTNLESLFNL